MKPNEDITQQESTLNIQEPTAAEVEVKVEVEAEAAPVPVPAETPAEDTIENLLLEIKSKIEELQKDEQYLMLCEKINRNICFVEDAKEEISVVEHKISWANKYVKTFAEDFLEAFSSTGWFDRAYDAVCLYDRANDSAEALNWCNSVKEAVEVTINDTDNEQPKLKVHINRRVPNSVFTLSLKTPYLRIKENEFSEIGQIVSVQSKMFYSWLKNIENLSLSLRNNWVDLEFPALKKDTYSEDLEFNLEKASQTSLSQYVESYIDANAPECEDKSFYLDIIDRINSFNEHLADIDSFYEKQHEHNSATVKYLTETLLADYYVKGLEPIYGIYDNIKIAADSLKSKYGECKETEKWCSLLATLELLIENFLEHQNVFPSPELIVDESNINNTDFVINDQELDFFSFAKIATATEAPRKELIDYVASIRNYGFWCIDRKDSRGYRILRETVVSVYN